ncbi:hypothetical protein SAMN05216229_12924 [Geopseudomonas sagittaria]|uniref:Uncharacterized protein n=1 Tax=Geopseudomonas sagittaria TaxID=1135990 RepID=A0A1I5Z6Z1_9GAMM|nr:hypothetical protein [Pseudomonas sagittaria]SFQ52211.1 hypothetical protein SAMN05216229_12924 [Pseudomonas sagittaria]
MLLALIILWTIVAATASAVAVRLRRRYRFPLWLALLILWSPWLLAILAVALFVLGEYLRAARIDELTPPDELRRQLEDGAARDPRALLQAGETSVCLFHSYDARRVATAGSPQLVALQDLHLPADDGWWYVAFFRGETLTRLHLVASQPVETGCLIREAADWPYSTFHREVRNGRYPRDWREAMKERMGFAANGDEQ